jgi:hypothetical protein
MLNFILNIYIKNEAGFQKVALYAEYVLLAAMNGMTLGMIDWVSSISNIFDSLPAMLLTLSMVLINLAKFAQIMVDVLIKKKKELDKLNQKENGKSDKKEDSN